MLLPIEWIYLLGAVILLLLSGIFSAAEIGLLSVNRFRVHQLAEDGSRRAQLLQGLLLSAAASAHHHPHPHYSNQLPE